MLGMVADPLPRWMSGSIEVSRVVLALKGGVDRTRVSHAYRLAYSGHLHPCCILNFSRSQK